MSSLSIAITSYNRQRRVIESIQSALAFLDALRTLTPAGVVIVDDASTDRTVEELRVLYADEIARGRVRIDAHAENLGAAAAKNTAIAQCRGDWVLILDSDDALVTTSAPSLEALLLPLRAPVLFCRCVDFDSGELVGQVEDAGCDIDLKRYLARGTPGECIPIVRREAFVQTPFEPRWRGREGWAWARMIEAFGPARLEQLVVRRYRQSHEQRISTRAGSRRHAHQLLQYHTAMLRRYGRRMGVRAAAVRVTKVLYYAAVALSQRGARLVRRA